VKIERNLTCVHVISVIIIRQLLDHTIKIYNVSGSSSEISATLQGHEGPVWQVSWAHPQFGGTIKG
jgi:WD40 repeat protein